MASTSTFISDNWSCDCDHSDHHPLPVCKYCPQIRCGVCFREMVFQRSEQTLELTKSWKLVFNIGIRCPECGDVSSARELVSDYDSREFFTKCPICQDWFKNKSFADHLLNSKCARFVCNFCQAQGVAPAHLLHCRELVCPICNHPSLTFEALEIHMRTHKIIGHCLKALESP